MIIQKKRLKNIKEGIKAQEKNINIIRNNIKEKTIDHTSIYSLKIVKFRFK